MLAITHPFHLKLASGLTHTGKKGIHPVCQIINGVYSEPAVTGDEAQMTPGHTASNLHLAAADKTPTAQTAKAT